MATKLNVDMIREMVRESVRETIHETVRDVVRQTVEREMRRGEVELREVTRAVLEEVEREEVEREEYADGQFPATVTAASGAGLVDFARIRDADPRGQPPAGFNTWAEYEDWKGRRDATLAKAGDRRPRRRRPPR